MPAFGKSLLERFTQKTGESFRSGAYPDQGSSDQDFMNRVCLRILPMPKPALIESHVTYGRGRSHIDMKQISILTPSLKTPLSGNKRFSHFAELSVAIALAVTF